MSLGSAYGSVMREYHFWPSEGAIRQLLFHRSESLRTYVPGSKHKNAGLLGRISPPVPAAYAAPSVRFETVRILGLRIRSLPRHYSGRQGLIVDSAGSGAWELAYDRAAGSGGAPRPPRRPARRSAPRT